jgi:hypothetical protein
MPVEEELDQFRDGARVHQTLACYQAASPENRQPITVP